MDLDLRNAQRPRSDTLRAMHQRGQRCHLCLHTPLSHPTRRPSMCLKVVNPMLIPHGIGTTYCARLPFLFRIVFARIRVDIRLPWAPLPPPLRVHPAPDPSRTIHALPKSGRHASGAEERRAVSRLSAMQSNSGSRSRCTPTAPCCGRILRLTRSYRPPVSGRTPAPDTVRPQSDSMRSPSSAPAHEAGSCASPQNNDDLRARDRAGYSTPTDDGRSSYDRPTLGLQYIPPSPKHRRLLSLVPPCTPRPRALIHTSMPPLLFSPPPNTPPPHPSPTAPPCLRGCTLPLCSRCGRAHGCPNKEGDLPFWVIARW
ncbi:hypothetical protein C8R45DRAFT_419114 [Mycena sanguinolenta]|nr:hypothetical protein C8R45DRAFT_419114 [Mycena sanguinolenta]